MTPHLFVLMIFQTFLNFSSRVLAGVLPPAGHIFEKGHPLVSFKKCYVFAILKQGASRGAASGGSDF